jgi:hypothetical protein
MNLSKNIKPISYLKANAAQVALELKESGEAGYYGCPIRW